MTAATLPPIESKTTMNLPVEHAFQVFTASFGSWWPHEYHIEHADVADVILESHEGGRWYERGVDGTECDWGRVLAWEAPDRIVFTWQINGSWQFDPDPTHASEIEVRFHADGPTQTTVEVEHRYFEPLVDGQAVHGAIHGCGGWPARALPRMLPSPGGGTDADGHDGDSRPGRRPHRECDQQRGCAEDDKRPAEPGRRQGNSHRPTARNRAHRAIESLATRPLLHRHPFAPAAAPAPHSSIARTDAR